MSGDTEETKAPYYVRGSIDRIRNLSPDERERMRRDWREIMRGRGERGAVALQMDELMERMEEHPAYPTLLQSEDSGEWTLRKPGESSGAYLERIEAGVATAVADPELRGMVVELYRLSVQKHDSEEARLQNIMRPIREKGDAMDSATTFRDWLSAYMELHAGHYGTPEAAIAFRLGIPAGRIGAILAGARPKSREAYHAASACGEPDRRLSGWGYTQEQISRMTREAKGRLQGIYDGLTPERREAFWETAEASFGQGYVGDVRALMRDRTHDDLRFLRGLLRVY